jgi:hydroxypyruvate isomerase
MDRRTFAGALLSPALLQAQSLADIVKKGRLKQGVCPGVFPRRMPVEDRCKLAVKCGVQGFDLIRAEDFPTLAKYGIVPSMASGGGGSIRDGLNRRENHDAIEKAMRELIDTCASHKAPNLITFSGNRAGQKDEEGVDNCVLFLNKVKAQAEDKGVTICMEYLNSKVNHKDYAFDNTRYGVEICKRVNSPRFKILYDLYHVQIMEGDIIRNVRDHIQYIAHFHTAGNPGRHEMDDTQEMNWKGIAKAVADLNFSGFVSHEYSPVRDPLQSLEETLRMFAAA